MLISIGVLPEVLEFIGVEVLEFELARVIDLERALLPDLGFVLVLAEKVEFL
jgi:hypothetical protein